ncbi:MAG: DNA cytosine methyltransferase [Bacteroidia bacterium]
MRILNLCAGVGGNRRYWTGGHITAVENDVKIAGLYHKLYPNDTIIVGDAYEFLKNNYENYDFVWISPPCQKHSKMMKATRHKVADYPDFKLYEVIIFLQHFFKGKWVVENVKPYYTPLIQPTAIIGRHLFWANFIIDAEEVKQPKGFITKSNLEGKKEMMKWLDIYFDEVIYYKNNHCPVQILRNCVHPNLGLQIFINYKKTLQ